jgi:hypothetical protein
MSWDNGGVELIVDADDYQNLIEDKLAATYFSFCYTD